MEKKTLKDYNAKLDELYNAYQKGEYSDECFIAEVKRLIKNKKAGFRREYG